MGKNRPIVAAKTGEDRTEYYGFRTYRDAREYIETHPELNPRLVKVKSAPKEVDICGATEEYE